MFRQPQTPSLKAAIATIHADPWWWRKALIGGALWLTVLGYPIVEGYQAESIENTHNGFPTPLPEWRQLGNKAVIGLFALVIDFFYFALPLLFAGLFLMCVALGVVLAERGIAVLGQLGTIVALVAAAWVVAAWLSSVSPAAKQIYVAEGQPASGIGGQVVHHVLRQPARSAYIRARLRSLPVYLAPIALLVAALYAMAWSGWLALLLIWLGLSALLYARLVVIQLYAAAAREIQLRIFERLQAQARR